MNLKIADILGDGTKTYQTSRALSFVLVSLIANDEKPVVVVRGDF